MTSAVFTFDQLHHVQLAIPPGGEGRCRAFWGGVLGMDELEKPPLPPAVAVGFEVGASKFTWGWSRTSWQHARRTPGSS